MTPPNPINAPNPTDILLNAVLVVSALVWLITQTTKFITARLTGRPARFFDSGGMPSAHAAVIAAAATVIGLDQGLTSPIFGLAVVVAAIVLHDAGRVRWMAGETAERVNELLKRAKSKGTPVPVYRGHRLSEVVVGTLFGIALGAVLFYQLYP